jgi:hypothetical protein
MQLFLRSRRLKEYSRILVMGIRVVILYLLHNLSDNMFLFAYVDDCYYSHYSACNIRVILLKYGDKCCSKRVTAKIFSKST